MKKILLTFLALLIAGMFLIGCAPELKESDAQEALSGQATQSELSRCYKDKNCNSLFQRCVSQSKCTSRSPDFNSCVDTCYKSALAASKPAVPKPTACVPKCTGKECGPDGCGGTCGSCDKYCLNAPGKCTPTCNDIGSCSVFKDSDNDGIEDGDDNCPTVSNADQVDTNYDGKGDTCTIPECGNGIVETGEACDDGNKVTNDGCSNNCLKFVCLDSDPSKDVNVKGTLVAGYTYSDGIFKTIYSPNEYGLIFVNVTDTCHDNNTGVVQNKCKVLGTSAQSAACPAGTSCKDGACVTTSVPSGSSSSGGGSSSSSSSSSSGGSVGNQTNN